MANHSSILAWKIPWMEKPRRLQSMGWQRVRHSWVTSLFILHYGLPWSLSGKESTCQCRRHKRCGFDPWVGKINCRRKWQPTPVFLPGRSHGQKSLMGYSSWGHKRAGHNLVTRHWQHIFPYRTFSVDWYVIYLHSPKPYLRHYWALICG